MKRRNFLSGLLAAPLALKARLLRFAAREPVSESLALQLQFIRLMNSGKPMKEIIEILQPGYLKRWEEKTAGLRGHTWLN